MPQRYFIGMASGSSILGVDAALVRADGVGLDAAFRLEHFLHAPYSIELRDLLARVVNNPAPDFRHLATLHRVLGETYALAAKQLLTQAKLPAQHVMAVGCSALPIWHDADGRYPSTLELGMMPVLAERSGLTTVSDFTGRDLALGGVGGPMTALADVLRFHHPDEDRVRVHVGTVAEVVWLPAKLGTNHRNVLGFQAAPATLLLDGLIRLLTNGREPFDAGGKHAVQGRCLEPLLARWMQDHLFTQRPPKCVSRIGFGPDFLSRAIAQGRREGGSLHDVLCTMTHFVATALVHALRTHLPATPARCLLSGKGLRNGLLWHLLEQHLAPMPLETTNANGVPADACKALGYATLAALTLDGVPINLPGVTGASGQRALGQLTPGSTANWAKCLTWMARQAAPVQSAAA